jgi:hypothetical protein
MFASHENASEVDNNNPPTSSTRARGIGSRSSTAGSSKYVIHLYLFSIFYALNIPNFSYLKTSDDASNIGGGSRTRRGRGTSSSRTKTVKYVTFFTISVCFEQVHAHILHWIFTDAFSLHFFK